MIRLYALALGCLAVVAVSTQAAGAGNPFLGGRRPVIASSDLDRPSTADGRAAAFARFLSETVPTAENLDLSRGQAPYITDDEAVAIARALRGNTTVIHLNLAGNHIGNRGAIAIAEALWDNSTLKYINLSHQNTGRFTGDHLLDDGAAGAFAVALSRNSTLEHLDLSLNRISRVGAVAIAGALSRNSSLKHLSLSRQQMHGDRGLDAPMPGGGTATQAIASALAENTTLIALDLESTGIGDDGAIAIAGLVRSNSTLQYLDLGFNEIGPAGAAALGAALPYNTTLTTLSLIQNPFVDAGAIAAGLAFNPTLTTLELPYRVAAREVISNLLARNARFSAYLPAALALMMSTTWPSPRVPGGIRGMPVEVWNMTLLEFLLPLSARRTNQR